MTNDDAFHDLVLSQEGMRQSMLSCQDAIGKTLQLVLLWQEEVLTEWLLALRLPPREL